LGRTDTVDPRNLPTEDVCYRALRQHLPQPEVSGTALREDVCRGNHVGKHKAAPCRHEAIHHMTFRHQGLMLRYHSPGISLPRRYGDMETHHVTSPTRTGSSCQPVFRVNPTPRPGPQATV